MIDKTKWKHRRINLFNLQNKKRENACFFNMA